MWTWLVLMTLVQEPVPQGRDAVVRPALVVLQAGSPVMLMGSRSSAEQPFAEVVVRNTSERKIIGVTFGVTIGRVVGRGWEEVVRKELPIDVAIEASATAQITLPAVGARQMVRDRLTGSATVELGILEVRFEDGSTWEASVGPTWLGQPDVAVPVRCADAAGVYAPGEMSLTSASGRRCAANGRFVVPGRDKEGR